jgi:predicted AAA+ superfamily ATPase
MDQKGVDDMLIRTDLDRLEAWYRAGDGRKPLLMRGARQVGKTTLVRMLAERLDLRLIELNMEKPWRFVSTLETLNPLRTVEAIEFELGLDIDPDRTILFFDEAQACPSVLPMLRYFRETAPQYAVIVTGSLLEFVLAQPRFSIPVGRIDLHHLGPLTLEEFLGAVGEDKARAWMQAYRLGESVPGHIHDKLNALARTYSVVGGMPEAVAVYAGSGSLKAAEKVKSGIIDTFRLDFNKYGDKADPRLLRLAFDAIPRLAGRKLIYSHIDSHVRSGELAKAVEQLRLARIIAKIHNTHANGIPLAAERNDRYFKVLGLDTGLLLTQLQLAPTDVIQTPELNLTNRGALAEQFIGQHLYASPPPYREPELHYWAREAPSASAEVDFVIADGRHRVVPVEVKAGGTGKLRSLQIMVQEKSLPLAVRFCSDPPTLFRETRATVKGNVDFKLISLPHYLVQQCDRLLSETE